MSQEGFQRQDETVVTTPTSSQVVTKTQVVAPRAETVTEKQDYQAKKTIFRAYQIIWYLLGAIEIFLTFRVILKLFGASTASGFTDFIYAISNPFALPFAGIFGITEISEMTFEWSTLIAMVVYAIVAYGIVSLFQIVKPTDKQEVEGTVDNQ